MSKQNKFSNDLALKLKCGTDIQSKKECKWLFKKLSIPYRIAPTTSFGELARKGQMDIASFQDKHHPGTHKQSQIHRSADICCFPGLEFVQKGALYSTSQACFSG